MKIIITILLFFILLVVTGSAILNFLYLVPQSYVEIQYYRQKEDAIKELYQACERQAKELKLQSYENLRGK